MIVSSPRAFARPRRVERRHHQGLSSWFSETKYPSSLDLRKLVEELGKRAPEALHRKGLEPQASGQGRFDAGWGIPSVKCMWYFIYSSQPIFTFFWLLAPPFKLTFHPPLHMFASPNLDCLVWRACSSLPSCPPLP